MKKECVAMLLAGGEGRRLGILTRDVAKPAVPFGGKYRIIDFTLSNCTNSGIYTVGVLTQYQPLALNSHIGIGSPWDLDRRQGGVTILPPFVREQGGKWYKGTANAIYQNLYFIEQYDPDHVLVISGDHIYKMNYARMIEYHQQKKAEVTIAVFQVPWKEASRFGVMRADPAGRVVEFQEKPEKPRSNLASMGVYVFDWQVLRKYLHLDEGNPASSNDFGKDVIPLMVQEGLEVYAYPFKGYWKDVGTVESLWEASMDLLSDTPPLDLYDRRCRIYTVNPNQPPYYIGPRALVCDSMINEGCMVFGEVRHSVLFPGVYVGEGAVVKDSVIMSNGKIQEGARVEKAIIGEEALVGKGCRISSAGEGEPPSQIILVQGNIAVPDYSVITENLDGVSPVKGGETVPTLK